MKLAPRALIVWIILSLIWGTTWLGVKIGVAVLPPFTFAGLRFGISALALAALLWWRRNWLPASRAQWKLIFWLGLLQIGLPFALTFWAAQYITSSLTAILFSVHPLFVMVLAHMFVPEEPIQLRRVVAALCGTSGIVAIFSQQLSFGRDSVAGSLAMVGAALCGALANIIAKRNVQRLDAITNTMWQMLVGAVFLFALAALAEEPTAIRWTMRAVLALLYLSLIGSATAFVLFYWLIKRVDVTFVSFIPIANTLVATLLGWLVLGEVLGMHTLVGGALILLGVVLASLPHRQMNRATARDSSGSRRSPTDHEPKSATHATWE